MLKTCLVPRNCIIKVSYCYYYYVKIRNSKYVLKITIKNHRYGHFPQATLVKLSIVPFNKIPWKIRRVFPTILTLFKTFTSYRVLVGSYKWWEFLKPLGNFYQEAGQSASEHRSAGRTFSAGRADREESKGISQLWKGTGLLMLTWYLAFFLRYFLLSFSNLIRRL